jgi:diguanylate cyclase (GGDEF)-like protein
VSTKELQQRVRAGKRVVELQDRLLSTHRKLAQLATRDQLTGVLNRVAIMDQLGEELERARNNTRQLGLLMLDIDAFNFINEEFGYPAGDEVLREMAGRLKRTIQSYDRVGRVSGGAFSVVVPETDLPHAVVVAERLRNEVRHQPFVIDGREITVSVSVGAASTSIEGFERKKLMVGAEKALARAKRDGRDCTRMSVGNGVIEDPLVSDLEVFA